MIEPLITIVIPIYNAQRYLSETVKSVLNQTYQNFELLLINHNSTDESSLIINSFEKEDKRVKVVNLDINKGGPAYPRNVGLQIAKGDYIAFLDADDVWLEDKLQRQLQFIKNQNADIVHTLANKIDENSLQIGEFKDQRVFNILKYILNKKNIIYYTNYININSVFMKREGVIEFSEDINLVAVEDWKLWIESIIGGKKIALQEEKLLNYRVHSASISNRSSDIGYRKSLYLLSLLLLQKKIPLKHYLFSSFFVICKILVKNI
jgi:teichuronic acid biosynthesis glycosyltransferase TuaG